MKNQEMLEPIKIFLAELSDVREEDIDIKTITQIDMQQVTVVYTYKGFEDRVKTISLHTIMQFLFKRIKNLKDSIKLLAWDKTML